MLLRLEPIAEEDGLLRLTVEVTAQNPGLNPALLAAAIARYLPQYKPDFVRVRRLDALDPEGKTFR